MKSLLRLSCVVLLLLQPASTWAGAVRDLPGFTSTVFGPNDDGTYPCIGSNSGTPSGTPVQVPIGFSIDFYGNTFTSLYVNNNGNVTFDSSLATFTPFGLVGTARQIIAPYFADVDTRQGYVVTFGNDTVDGHQAFGVNWIDVGYFDENTDRLNSFQLILIDRSDRNPGDFDIEFNYDQVQWETGDASSGVDGLGGSSAVAGFSNGSGLPGTSFQINGSAIPGEFLDSNAGGLIFRDLNSSVLGRYVFPIVNIGNLMLDVPRFGQGDARWATRWYAGSRFTIQQRGCALTALAMALNYAGIPTDPGTLNALMIDDNDFVGTSLNWGPATRDASGGALQFHAYRTSDVTFLSQALANGYPVIVGVNLNANGAPGHFVLVIGEQDGEFLINDPGHASRTNLSAYNNSFETRGYVGAVGTTQLLSVNGNAAEDLSGLDVAADNNADVLILDPLGRRTGYDPVTGMVLEEIPQSVHFLDCVENNDLTGEAGTNTAHIVDIFEPTEGGYQTLLIGQGSGSYGLSTRSFTQGGASTPPMTQQGLIVQDSIVTNALLSISNVVTFTVTPSAGANGKISPNIAIAVNSGDSAAFTATPTNGYVVNQWLVNSNLVQVGGNHFTLSNVTADQSVEVTFATPIAGVYQGLFYDTNGAALQDSGFFKATTTSKEKFTATLRFASKSYSLSGQFSAAGSFSNSIPRKGLSPLTVQLQLAGINQITGQVVDGSSTLFLIANRGVFNAKTHPTSLAGKYTMVIPGSDNSSAQPGGDGYATVTIDGSGNVTLSGKLGDGTTLSQKTAVSADGQWPLFAAPYPAGAGSIFGWLTVSNQAVNAVNDIAGALSWIQLAQPKAKLYPGGFTNDVAVAGSRYSFTKGVRVLNLTTGVVVLQNGNLAQSLTNLVTLLADSTVTSTNSLKLTITKSSGLFKGSVINPATRKTVSFNGVLLQKQNAGYGAFSGTNQTGSVYFGL